MPTTQEEKPVKPRSRSRKTDQKAAKASAKAQVAPDPVSVEAEPVGAMLAVAIEEAAAAIPQAEVMPADIAPNDAAPNAIAPVAAVMEKAPDAPLTGEVLPPDVKDALQPASLSDIALVYDDYTRKSWAVGRSLVERLIAARSFEEAIEVQNEFARQTYANFIAQSQRICVLYGEWAQQFFARYEKLATEWTQTAR